MHPDDGGPVPPANDAAPPVCHLEVVSPQLAVLTLLGEQDLHEKLRLEEAMARATVYRNVLVDLSACTFVDSSTIATIVTAYRRVHDAGGRLELVVPLEARSVRRSLELMGVDAFIPFHASRTDAIAALRE
jgi:stage II sporulation protein AA (anti-sigma F factor antagonist)